ncbi:MAG TPA: hypothetical protein VI583_10930 [Cyclobacteriaceae bacterium]|nr:hypothetical protein [Cyclobacteriaceae bacterium]
MNSGLILSDLIRKEARKDILELELKISKYRSNEMPEDKFKHFRLTRGVYGQRQLGVQMVRIKIPHGRLTSAQLHRVADVSRKYATGNLHLTTRQDIQLHFVKLENSPALWAELEEENITLREACGNTVRNVTGSPVAGIDPHEPFDITPYADAFTNYFLRNPVCQDMGRKFKVAFSSNEQDSAFTYIHDIGFIPRIKTVDGADTRGFKVLLGGGLGAQAIMAQVVYEFLPADEYIPFAEAVIRVFDRYGERTNRSKARMKFLVQKLGLTEFMKLVEIEKTALKHKKFRIEIPELTHVKLPNTVSSSVDPVNPEKFNAWKRTNIFGQKQKGFYGVFLRVQTGDINHENAHKLADIILKYAADDIRITINQGMLLRYIREDLLVTVFNELDAINLAEPGFNSTHDVTTCPGTDTCNLGVTNSMELARVLEKVLKEEFDDLIYDNDIHIKISGCMNSCGQHMAAQIGFHGSSIKKGELVAPAMQVVLGGGVDPDGTGYIADKIVKIPTRRIPEVLRLVLNDFNLNKTGDEYFNAYYRRVGKMHFYHLLKPLAEVEYTSQDFIDWGHEQIYVQEIGVGECASLILDVVGTIIGEAVEKLDLAKEGLAEKIYADSIYNSYNAFVIGAKAVLLSQEIQCNTQAGIIRDFNEKLVKGGLFPLGQDFEETVLEINKNVPSSGFAEEYLKKADHFLGLVREYRENQLKRDKDQETKTVVANYYKA